MAATAADAPHKAADSTVEASQHSADRTGEKLLAEATPTSSAQNKDVAKGSRPSFGQPIQTQKVDGKTVVKPETGDLTFAEASAHLKLDITPANLQQQIPQIKDRLKLAADGKDPQTGEPTTPANASDANFQTRAQFAVQTNEAIDKLQAKGIDVIHAAGNDGPNRFSLDFLSAKFDLSANGPNGRPENFSASNSHTTPANGFFPVELKSSPSVLDPALTSKQETTELKVGNKNIFFSSQGANTEPALINRFKATPNEGGSEGLFRTTQPSRDDVKFAPNRDAAAPPLVPSDKSLASPDTKKFTGSAGDQFSTVETKVLSGVKPKIVGLSPGTSLSVIDLLDGKSDRSTPLPEPR